MKVFEGRWEGTRLGRTELDDTNGHDMKTLTCTLGFGIIIEIMKVFPLEIAY